jgi:hypothetical protein
VTGGFSADFLRLSAEQCVPVHAIGGFGLVLRSRTSSTRNVCDVESAGPWRCAGTVKDRLLCEPLVLSVEGDGLRSKGVFSLHARYTLCVAAELHCEIARSWERL